MFAPVEYVWLRGLRTRTSLGFGVHSPFAYSFIRDTLRLPKSYGYYGYAYIRELKKRFPSVDSALMELWMRIGVRFQPENVYTKGRYAQEMYNIMRIAKRRCGFSVLENAEMAYIDGDCESSDKIIKWLDSGNRVLLLPADKAMRLKVCSGRKWGMAFDNGDVLVVISDRDLPRRDFLLNF